MYVAPASVASSTICSTCSGASLIPGISGAIRTPVGIPLRLSSATASSRARGCGVCGSVARHAFSSSVGTDRQALTSVTCRDLLQQVEVAQHAAATSSGSSTGCAKSRIASQIPRMSL